MRTAVFWVLAIACLGAHAARVDNFSLLDHRGAAHELHYYSDATAIVLIVHGNGCPIVRNALADYRAVSDVYAPRGVRFLMINANLQDGRDAIAQEAAEWDIPYPILVDETQLVGESLGLERTAEVLVIDPSDWRIVYRGAVNDRLSYERQKAAAEHHYLRDALDAVLAGSAPNIKGQAAMGCLMNLPGKEADHAKIAYRDDIAPLLQQNCVQCHRQGGVAPWAMTSYEMVRGFAPMIREVIRTRRMPPWHADPHVGTWRNDKGLTVAERQTLVHWIEAGAPRGDGPDPLLETAAPAPEWALGEPDVVIDIPAFDVASSGVVDYQFHVVPNPLDRDVWVQAMDVQPGVAEVVHHVLVGTTEAGAPAKYSSESLMNNYLGGYAPGVEPQVMPEGTGVFVPKGTGFMFQMHYTPYGKAVTDRSRLGLYLHDEPPANFLRHGVVLNPTIRIPANAKEHAETAYFEFHREATLYTVLPHSHYRGRSSTFELLHPNGERELVLSVPDYDFNWQRGYDFATPRLVAPGTRLIHTTVYDNSAQNPGNPDPSRVVPWGLQSHDEMLYGDFVFSWTDERSDAPIHDNAYAKSAQQVGFLDRDMNGSIGLEELSPPMRKRLRATFALGDANGDNALTAYELLAGTRAARQRAAKADEELAGD